MKITNTAMYKAWEVLYRIRPSTSGVEMLDTDKTPFVTLFLFITTDKLCQVWFSHPTTEADLLSVLKGLY